MRKLVLHLMQHWLKSLLWSKRLLLIVFSLSISFTLKAQLPPASQIASEMGAGWNLGNTLEAIGGETAWGNPMATQQLINSVKAAGFNTVRLPVAWDIHANQSTGQIDPAWMNRVQEVVDYCMNANVYVVLNIHWDGGWLEDNVNTSSQAGVNAKQQNYWNQIATRFRNYDHHLLFASANEPHADNASEMAVLMSYHQTFVNTVRATGGNNSSRTLIIQGPSTDIEKTNQLMNTLPTDQIADRMMVEVHYYTPFQFCLMTEDASWGNMFYFWGNGYHSSTNPSRNATWGEEADLDNLFNMMESKFVDNGIPVIIGEFLAIKRNNLSGADLNLHLDSREYFHEYVTDAAMSRGMIPIYWDTGDAGSGLINRNNGAIVDQATIDVLTPQSNSNTGIYQLQNRGTGMFLDGLGRTTNGEDCAQWSNTSHPNSQWEFIDVGNGYVQIRNVSTGLYLDGMGRTANGANVGMWANTSSYNSHWALQPYDGHYRLQNRATGLYLDGMGRSTNGEACGQYANTTHPNVQWSLVNSSSRVTNVQGMQAGDIMLYPNPATNGDYTLILPFEESYVIRITDTQGKAIYTQDFTGREVNIQASLKPGLYNISINSPSSNVIKKLIIKE